MVELAVGDQALLLVSAKTEIELVNRTADLTQYIYQFAIVGTDAVSYTHLYLFIFNTQR